MNRSRPKSLRNALLVASVLTLAALVVAFAYPEAGQEAIAVAFFGSVLFVAFGYRPTENPVKPVVGDPQSPTEPRERAPAPRSRPKREPAGVS